MSHLAHAIEEQLTEHKMTGAELARKSGINEARISRWRNGQQLWIDPAELSELARGFGAKPEIHADLLYGRLQDMCCGPGAKFINIAINTRQKTDQTRGKIRPVMPPHIQADLEVISAVALSDQPVREMLHALGRLCRDKSINPPSPS